MVDLTCLHVATPTLVPLMAHCNIFLVMTSQILDKYHPADYYLPESYTCFFLLKIPRYSCKPVLEEKLRYAINFCKSIDTDDYARVNLQEGLLMDDEVTPTLQAQEGES